ncbi:hypothetical protein [Mycobacterium sp. 2YAF39]|uniref:hypothetical protein n=1 Tax=Mycobacterium sp. 2YAF39 TaxID=3233033 RepID=UPI003F9C4DAA
MGSRFHLRSARQHPDLSSSPPGADYPRFLVLTLLAIDGALCAILASLFLPTYIGSWPFPVSALIAGLVNAALVWAALHWATSPRTAALPLGTWLLTVAVLSLGGPGDDIVYGGPGVMEYGALLLLVLGTLPPAAVLWRHMNA